MKVRVRPFAFYRELLGLRALEVQVADRATLADLKDSLDKTFPKLKDYLPLMAVNGEMKQLFDPLKDGDEVALLPPFSGGAAHGGRPAGCCAGRAPCRGSSCSLGKEPYLISSLAPAASGL